MITVLQWAAFLLYFSPLLLVGYVISQMIRDARRERMGWQLSTMPLAEDEPDNPFALNRRLLGISLPETRPTMQEAAEGLTMMARALPSIHDFDLLNRPPNPDLDTVYSKSGKPCVDLNRPVPIIQYGTPLPVAYYDHATGMVQRVDTADVKQEPLHDLSMECEMMEGI